MRLCLLLLTGLLLLPVTCSVSYAQGPESTPTVTLDLRQVPVSVVFTELEKQTGMFFSYESALLEGLPNVSVTAKDEILSYCLRNLFTQLPLTYRITGQYIILKRKPRQYTVSGFVRDSASWESLLGASVVERNIARGVVSNNYGFYSITLAGGPVTIRASYVGYESKEVSFFLAKDTMVEMSLQAAGRLGEVLVEGISPLAEVMDIHPGRTDIPVQSITSMPALLGEADLVKTLQQLPGVAQGMEGMTGLYVRGGNADENLFLVDGNPVYHVNHMGGFFSAFNPDAIKNTTFYKSGFPAQYGGRASSVIDVRMRDGDRQEYHGNISIGLVSARGNFEGPIVKGRSSFNVSVRRTWSDLITVPVFALINQNKRNNIKALGFHFYDINAKVNHSFSERSQLYLNFYTGDDSYKSSVKNNKDIREGDVFRWRWGNLIGSANWSYVFNNHFFANYTIGYSRYRSRITQTKNEFNFPGEGKPIQISHQQNSYHSNVQDVSFRADFDYRPHRKHRIRMGTDYRLHLFMPESDHLKYWYKDSEITQHRVDTPYMHSRLTGHEFSVYVEDEMSPSSRLSINVGMRHTLFRVENRTYHSFQPRISARYLLLPALSAKVSYSKMNQYIHQLSNSYINLPTDLWVPVTGDIPPISSHQFTGGLYYNLKKEYNFCLEGYYKKIENQIEYNEHLPLLSTFAGWDQRVSVGEGLSYGLEAIARKSIGQTTGWVAYTLSWTKRRFPGTEISRGNWYPAKYDNRHKVNITVSHRFSKKIDLNASWVIASGNHITIMTDQYLGSNIPDNHWGTSGQMIKGSTDERNNYQLPPYHRLDLGINLYYPKKRGRMGIWNFGLYNAYMQMNPFMVTPEYHINGDKAEVVLKKTTIFFMIPSVSYTYKF